MSLSSLLLSTSAGASTSKGIIDGDLDSLFRSRAAQKSLTDTPVPASRPSEEREKKRKSVDQDVGSPGRLKKPKAEKEGSKKKSVRISDVIETQQSLDEGSPVRSKGSGKVQVAEKKRGKERKGKQVNTEEEEDNSDLEESYLAGKSSSKNVPPSNEPDSDEGDISQLVHESLQKGSTEKDRSKRSKSKSKYVPPDETEEQRSARTIFVGNLSVEVAQKRPVLKQLQRHILAQVPSAKIESTRFRSVPFQIPTSKLPTDDSADSPKTSKAQPDPTSKQSRSHDRDRASTWRQSKADEDDSGKNDEKKFLNPKEKKKIAFINQDFHSSADTVNAYIVFSHPLPVENRPANLPPPPPTMDPYEAARMAVELCNGTMFMERMIRVDHVSQEAKKEARSGDKAGMLDGDPKLNVFVGNLDFASKEEDLRVFFEGLVGAERGPPGTDADEDSADGSKKPKTWVTHVRIIRDKETQMGKGIAYVQFMDRECVDEILALEESKLKFAKRKLRVQRCKSLPGQPSTITTRPGVTAPAKGRPATPRHIPLVPKGDPALGAKLAHLPKEERKQVKSSDADRVARRLAKKKARNALVKDGVKPLVKDRDRVRKGSGGKNAHASAPRKKETSRGRVRSERSLTKRNVKK